MSGTSFIKVNIKMTTLECKVLLMAFLELDMISTGFLNFISQVILDQCNIKIFGMASLYITLKMRLVMRSLCVFKLWKMYIYCYGCFLARRSLIFLPFVQGSLTYRIQQPWPSTSWPQNIKIISYFKMVPWFSPMHKEGNEDFFIR